MTRTTAMLLPLINSVCGHPRETVEAAGVIRQLIQWNHHRQLILIMDLTQASTSDYV